MKYALLAFLLYRYITWIFVYFCFATAAPFKYCQLSVSAPNSRYW